MSASTTIARWLLKWKPLRANYEAARWSFDRSYIPGSNTDAQIDIGAGSRIEIMRRARYFEKNHCVPNKILDLIETNVVGTGINPTPLSKNDAWNLEALQRWNDWIKVADVTSRQDFYSLQAVISRAQAVDGEIFVWLTTGETGNARVQLIESHRCVDGDATAIIEANPGFKHVDGIIIDQRGRPQYYLFSDDYPQNGKPSSVTAVPAGEVVHFFEPSRAGQLRGLSIFHCILAMLHDLDDLQRYEMLAAKDASSRTNVVTTKNGELPSGNLIGRSLQQVSQDGTTLASRIQYFERNFGGKTVAIQEGETWEQSQSNRPSVVMREFWEYLVENCCKGVGISFAAVQDYRGNWGGAALRGAVTSDNRFYEIRTRSLGSGFDRIWRHVIGTDIARKAFTSEIPPDWYSVKWQPPRRASVDIGYDSAAVINDLRAANRTQADIIGEGGADWRVVKRQRAIEMAYDLALEKEFGLQPNSLSVLFPNPPPIMGADQAPQPGEKKP